MTSSTPHPAASSNKNNPASGSRSIWHFGAPATRMSALLSPARSSPRQILRAATADLHADVDARFSGAFDGSVEGYAHFLSAMASALLPLERALEEAGVEQVLPDWTERRRAALLLDDLAALGGEPVPEIRAPAAAGEARQLGMVYVLEGSRLGGKLLLKRALGSTDRKVRAATRYLSHGTGRNLWSSFLERLESSPDVSRQPAEAIAGARDAFALFGGRPVHG
jgi:heme oxygenase